eukprot:g3380.t1
MNFSQSDITPLLAATLSPDGTTRREAERQLEVLQQAPGFDLGLLQCVAAPDKPQLAAAVLFKNIVLRRLSRGLNTGGAGTAPRHLASALPVALLSSHKLPVQRLLAEAAPHVLVAAALLDSDGTAGAAASHAAPFAVALTEGGGGGGVWSLHGALLVAASAGRAAAAACGSPGAAASSDSEDGGGAYAGDSDDSDRVVNVGEMSDMASACAASSAQARVARLRALSSSLALATLVAVRHLLEAASISAGGADGGEAASAIAGGSFSLRVASVRLLVLLSGARIAAAAATSAVGGEAGAAELDCVAPVRLDCVDTGLLVTTLPLSAVVALPMTAAAAARQQLDIDAAASLALALVCATKSVGAGPAAESGPLEVAAQRLALAVLLGTGMQVLACLFEVSSAQILVPLLAPLVGTLFAALQAAESVAAREAAAERAGGMPSFAGALRRRTAVVLSVLVGRHGAGALIDGARAHACRAVPRAPGSAAAMAAAADVAALLSPLVVQVWCRGATQLDGEADCKACAVGLARLLCEGSSALDGAARAAALRTAVTVGEGDDGEYNDNVAGRDVHGQDCGARFSYDDDFGDEALLAAAAAEQDGVAFARLHFASTDAELDDDPFEDVEDGAAYVYCCLARAHAQGVQRGGAHATEIEHLVKGALEPGRAARVWRAVCEARA